MVIHLILQVPLDPNKELGSRRLGAGRSLPLHAVVELGQDRCRVSDSNCARGFVWVGSARPLDLEAGIRGQMTRSKGRGRRLSGEGKHGVDCLSVLELTETPGERRQ